MQFKFVSILALAATIIAAPTATLEETQAEWSIVKHDNVSVEKRTVGGVCIPSHISLFSADKHRCTYAPTGTFSAPAAMLFSR
jgi:hypothetical protein